MKEYVLSLLGIALLGVLIEIILPSGVINKYIKSIYSIFVIAVLIMPVVNFFGKTKDVSILTNDIQINEKVLNYVFSTKVQETEKEIKLDLEENGFTNLDIVLNYSIIDNKIIYNSCLLNLKNLTISQDKQHINKYEFIKGVVCNYVDLTSEEIIIDE